MSGSPSENDVDILKVGLDSGQFDQQVAKTERTLERLAAEARKSGVSFDEFVRVINSAVQPFVQTDRAMEGLVQSHREAAQAADALAQKMGQEGVAATQAGAAVQGLSAAQQQLNERVQSTMAALQAQSQVVDRLRQSLADVGQRPDFFVRMDDSVRSLTGSLTTAQAAAERFAGVLGRMPQEDYDRRAADIRSYGEEMDRLRAKFNPLFAAGQQYRQQLRELNEAHKLGAISAAEHGAALERLRTRLEQQVSMARGGGMNILAPVADGMESSAGRMKLAQHQVTNLMYQVNDVFAQLASGSSPVMIFAQQGPQVADALGGWTNAGRMLLGILTPLNIAIAATAGVVVASTVAYEAQERRVIAMGQRLQAFRADYEAVARTISDVSGRIAASTNISASDARATGQTLASVRGVSMDEASLRNLTVLTADFAAALGQKVPEAASRMADALRSPLEAAKKLRDDGMLGFDDATVRLIQRLTDLGQRTEAQRVFTEALDRSVGGASQRQTELGAAMSRLGNAFQTATGSAEPFSQMIGRWVTSEIASLVNLFASFIEKVGELGEALNRIQVPNWIKSLGNIVTQVNPLNPFSAFRFGNQMAAPETGDGLVPGSLSDRATQAQIRAAVEQQYRASTLPASGISLEQVLAMVQRESGFRQTRPDGSPVTSPRGALGVMQLMPSTAAEPYVNVDPRDTASNIIGGIRYIEWLNAQLGRELPPGSAARNSMGASVAAAYNAGIGRFLQFIREPGAGLPSETRAYVASVVPGPEQQGSSLFNQARDAARLSGWLRDPNSDLPSDTLGRRQSVQRRIGTIEGMLASPAGQMLEPGELERYNRLLRDYRAILDGLRDPEERRAEAQRQELAILAELGPAAQRLARARMQEMQDAQREGRAANPDRAQAVAQAEMNEQLNVFIGLSRLSRENSARLAEGLRQGGAGAAEAEARFKAQNDALNYGTLNSEDYRRAVERLTAENLANARSQADVNSARQAANYGQQLEMIEAETRLIGASVETRMREIAALRERQRIINERGDPNSLESQNAIRMAQEVASATANLQRQQSAFNEIARIGEQAFDRIGSAITSAFATGSLKALDFKSITRAVFSEVLQGAMRLAAINPLKNWLSGTNLPTIFDVGGVLTGGGLPSIFGGTPQPVAAAAQGGGMLEQAGMLASASSLYRGITGGISGSSFFNAAAPFAESGLLMGSTGLGSLLNTPIIAASAGTGINAAGAVTNAAGYGSMAANSIDAAGSAAAAGVGSNGLTIGSALGPAAAIGGGIYGAITGFQRGGVGGTLSGLGGVTSAVTGGAMLASAAGLLPALGALGPAGLIAGAILAIAGSLLPGAKPSSAAQGVQINTETGVETYDGNRRNFSQANLDEARRFATSIANLETTLEQRLGFGTSVSIGAGVDSARRGDPANIFLNVGNRRAEFSRDEDGARKMADQAAAWILEEFKAQADRMGLTSDQASILRNSASAEALGQNLEWYEQTYKALTQTTEATSAYATSLANLRKPYDEAISKADQLGLATDALVRKRDEELARATRARDLQLQQIDFDLANRAAGSAGLVAASQAALAAEREVEQLRETLRNLGLSAAETATRLDQLAQAQARQQQTLVTAMRAEGRLDVSSTFTGVIQPLQQLLQFWQQSGGLSDRGVAPEEAWPWMFNQLKSMLGGLSYDQLKSVEVAFPQVPGADDDAVRQVVAELKRQIVQQNDRAFLDATGRGPINQIRDLIAQFEQLAPRLAEMGQNAAAWQTLEAQLGALMRDMSAEQVAAIKAAFPQGTFQPHIPGTDRQEDDLIRRIAAAREAELAAAEASAKAAEASAKAAQDLEQALQAGGSIRAFLDGLRSTGAGGLSPQEQLLNAQGAFGRDLALARGGDADALARITGTAQNLLAAGQGMYASSPDFAALRAFVMSSLESLPATRTYDAQILKALQDLGGSVNVAVEVQSVRQISEVLNALSTEDKARLVQTATVVRTVEERLGRALTATEREGLIQAADVLRTVQQSMGADLTAAQRAGLVQGGAVIRSIEQGLSRSLTASERAALIEGGAIGSYVFQFLQRDLTESERAALVAGGTALRQVEQTLARDLTDAERDSLIQSGYALHAVFQMMGGNLSAAERDSLVQSALVVRSIEQSLARSLTDAERASLVDGGAIGSFVYQFLQRDLTAAERAALVQAGIVSRDVRQAIETTETVQISRSVDDKLSGILQAINRSMLSLIVVSQAGFASVARTVASGTYTSPGVALDQSGRLGEYQDDSGFVASLYRSLLRREPDPQGMSAILAFLGRGGSRGEVLDGFTFAPEFWRVGYASGGLVTGGIPGVDSVPANLMPGEYVLRAEAVRGLGAANLDVLNAGYIPAVPVANDGGSTEEVRELRRAVQGLREEVAALRAERARDAQQVKASLSRTADAAEDTAASNRVIARDSRGVVGDRRRAG